MLGTAFIVAARPSPCLHALAVLVVMLVLDGTSSSQVNAQSTPPRFVQELPGEGSGKFFKGDLQRRFADSELTPTQFVARAVDEGCELVIVTPARPTDTSSILNRFLDDVAAAQRAFPKTVILPGYNWAIRVAGLKAHATILVPPGPDFRARYLDLPKQFVKSGSETTSSQALTKTLQKLCPDTLPTEQWPVIIFDQFRDGSKLHRWSVEHLEQENLWAQSADKPLPVLGQSGLLDRWDQSDVRSGAEWDKLLADGRNAWAAADDLDLIFESARAKSGRSTETFLRLPELTAANVLQALRAGDFYGVRGGLVKDVEFTVTADGLPRPALPGETIDLPVGTPIRVRLSLTVPDLDSRKLPNRLDGVELISVTPEHSDVVHKVTPQSGRLNVEYETEVPVGGVLFRALGYRVIKDAGDHSFYTNPIRILANGRWERTEVQEVRARWQVEDAILPIIGLLIALSLVAVGGWLAATGKLSLLLGDFFRPLIRVWQKTTLHRWLSRYAPSLLGRMEDTDDTLGTSLTSQESQGILATVIAGGVVLGALAGFVAWPTDRIPWTLLQHRFAGLLIGAACGGVISVVSRYRPSFALWVWSAALTVAAALPQAGWERSLPALLAMGLMASVAAEPLRMGVVRWPVEFPAAGVFCVLGLNILSAAAAMTAPLPWSGLVGLIGPLAAVIWTRFNLRETRHPLRSMALIFLGMLWLGGRLITPVSGDQSAWLSVISALSEAVGIAALWSVSQPKRWDAIRLFLIAPACGVLLLALRNYAGNPEPAFLPLAPLALMTALLLLAADTVLLVNLCGGVAVIILAKTLLFSPDQPQLWLLGSLAALAAAAVHRAPVRVLFFVLPYLLVSGYLLIDQASLPPTLSPIGSYAALVQRGTAALQADPTPAAGTLAAVGRMLCLFSLAGLTALAWMVRNPRQLDVFDAVGRMSAAALLFSGALLGLSISLPGSMLLVFVVPIGLWAANLTLATRSTASTLPDTALEAVRWRHWRTRLGIAAAVLAGLLAYGSLVPFHWRDIGWTEAVRAFLEQVRTQPVWTKINSDRIVNLLLTVPFAACAYGAMVLGRRDITARLWALVEALQLSLVISVAVEMAQKWSEGRVASVDDVIAQAIGAAIGILVWIAVGERFVVRWAASDRMQSQEGRWEQLLGLYLLGVLILSVLPVGLPVTSPKQLYDRYRDGFLSPRPFADAQTWDQFLRDAVVGVLLFIPVGVWSGIAFHKPGTTSRSFISALCLGTAFAALITLLRSLIAAEATDSSWLLTGVIGSAIGAAAAQYQVSRRFDSYANWRSGCAWWSVSLVLAVVIAGNLLHPWVFDASPEIIAARWKQFIRTPFAGFHTGDDWNLIEEVLRKLAWFLALGLMFGQSVCRTSELRTGRIIGGAFSILLAALLAVAIELAQLHQPHRNPDITDVLIYVIGAALGLWLRFGWLNENMLDDVMDTVDEPELTRAGNSSWLTVLQTMIAIGLLLGLVSGLALLFLRR